MSCGQFQKGPVDQLNQGKLIRGTVFLLLSLCSTYRTNHLYKYMCYQGCNVNFDSSHNPGTGGLLSTVTMITVYLWEGVEGSSGHRELMLSPAQQGTHIGKQSIQHLWKVGGQNPLPQLSQLAWDQLGVEQLKFVYLGASGKEEQHLTSMQGENHCMAVKRKTEIALGKQGNICHSFRKQQERT